MASTLPIVQVAPPPPPSNQSAGDPTARVHSQPHRTEQGARHKKDDGLAKLIQDTAFAAAVKAGDVQMAARAAWAVCQAHTSALLKRVQEDRAAQQSSQNTQSQKHGTSDDKDGHKGLHPHHHHHGRHHREKDGEEDKDKAKELKAGDWVLIQSVRKQGDSELVGHQAHITSFDAATGNAELVVPKLGTTARLHSRYLTSLAGQGPAARPGSQGGGEGGPRQKEGNSRRGSTTSLLDDGSADSDDEKPTAAGRGSNNRKHHYEGYARPTSIGQPIPPARIGAGFSSGRAGSHKARQLLKCVVRELSSLEEVVPWDCVDTPWKGRRASWRKVLRHLDISKPADVIVPTIANAMKDFHEALLTDKTAPAGSMTGILANGSHWHSRLQELVSSGNNPQCLQHVWEEFNDAMRVWLHSQGHALPPTSTTVAPQPPPPPPFMPSTSNLVTQALPGQPSSQQQQQPHPGHMHRAAQGTGTPLPPPPPLPLPSLTLPRTFDKAAVDAVRKSVRLLQAGTSVTSPDLPVTQLAADRVVALGRDAHSMLKQIVTDSDEASLGSALEALAAACDLSQLLGLTPGDLDRLSDADVMLLLLVNPALRAELRTTCGIDSEPDTDEDMNGEITDMEVD